MLLSSKYRAKECSGALATKLATKRFFTSWLESARSKLRCALDCGVLTKVTKVPSSSVFENV